MGWSSNDYHYTKEELKPAEVRAGCCNGWYWIHKRPNMFLGGYINDDGSYYLTYYKPNNSLFEYFIQMEINGNRIFDFKPSELNRRVKQKSVSGKLPPGTQRAKVVLKCGAPVCDVGANTAQGKVILDVDLDPYVGVYHNNSWRRAYVYTFTNGQWKLCKHTIHDINNWRKPITI